MNEKDERILFDEEYSFQQQYKSNLDETQIEYNFIYLIHNLLNLQPQQENIEIMKKKNNNNNKLEIESNLIINKLHDEMISYVEEVAQDFIWNNECFYIDRPKKYQDFVYTSSSVVDYGDNLEDEWYIVNLLFKLTRKFPNLIAQCRDSDGEFLLIHAANYLPEWASNATNMSNRVFIYNGALHLIPPAQKPSQITYLPQFGSLNNYSYIETARSIFDFPSITMASEPIQNSIMRKINVFDMDKNYPFHRATCYIPTKLAILLKNNPNLISKAINRFCDKDPLDLKLCRTLNTFKPVDMINYRIQFTKHLYSKLKYCEYKPEKRQDWPPIVKLPQCTMNAEGGGGGFYLESKEKSLLGFKLTCAFEILSRILLQHDHTASKSFDDYIHKLKNLGYFKNYLENSKKYNELYEIAKESFDLNSDEDNRKPCSQEKKRELEKTVTLANVHNNNNNNNNNNKNINMNKYKQLMDSIYLDKVLDEDYVVKVKEEISNNLIKEEDDSEEWLCVDAPQFDDYLEMYSRGDAGSTYDFRLITNAIKNFIEKPTEKKKDLLDGVDFKSIDKKQLNEDEMLVDFNLDAIEQNLKDYMKQQSKNQDEEFVNEDEEEDSFYAVDDDLEDNEDFETNKLSDSIKNYMSLMDEELKEQKNLSRLGGNSAVNSKENKSKNKDGTKSDAAAATKAEIDELDIDLNLVTNALESYSSQLGLTGPVANILKSLGI
jgi:hypothetical protein